jgi:hypothetical protein
VSKGIGEKCHSQNSIEDLSLYLKRMSSASVSFACKPAFILSASIMVALVPSIWALLVASFIIYMLRKKSVSGKMCVMPSSLPMSRSAVAALVIMSGGSSKSFFGGKSLGTKAI